MSGDAAQRMAGMKKRAMAESGFDNLSSKLTNVRLPCLHCSRGLLLPEKAAPIVATEYD